MNWPKDLTIMYNVISTENFILNSEHLTLKHAREDGGPGGCGVHISSQLGHLPGTGGDHGHLTEWEESPSNWVGCGGEQGRRRSGGRMEPVFLKGNWGRGGVPTSRGETGETILRAEDQKGMWPAFPLPTWDLGNLLRCRV